ncbi:protein-L-isoaspartate O-methyltransferase family protein [Methylocystis parvus]|uniref:Protein-L-isoaspartate O-methyltransferase n=1 Tax=Methylocystis parvus TaxID=134 RepID=A0A6B8M9H7_9HYPH|nr:protein-L-isoaspartate O-methyltransferase [Methylocystis parvus]QGM99065.1 protein-L-isoaspartate O-methyltransferase [Methylocystis parvus]WBK00568.1 protein-L-isoaspartate O-methyltransferase [Methylocystis parvus OBBP]
MSEAAVATVRRDTEQGQAVAELRRTMVDRQLRPFDVTDVPLLERFLDVPRELFLPASQGPLAYSDLAITVKGAGGHKRTLLPPLVLARLLQGGAPRPGEKALDIGGAGYSAALLSSLVGDVVALESDPELAARAKEGLAAIGAKDVRVETGPLEKGFAAAAPYDVIYVQGAVEAGLDALFAQLAPNGRLLTIVTPETGAGQHVVRYERQGGQAAGRVSLLSANATVLEGFAKPQAFSF